MDSHKFVRNTIKKLGKLEAEKRFQRMASGKVKVTLDNISEDVVETLKAWIVLMGQHGLEFLANEKNVCKKRVDNYLETTQHKELYEKYINKEGKNEKDNDNS